MSLLRPVFMFEYPIFLHEVNQARHPRSETVYELILFRKLPLPGDRPAKFGPQATGSVIKVRLIREGSDPGHRRADPADRVSTQGVHEAPHVGDNFLVLTTSGCLDQSRIL